MACSTFSSTGPASAPPWVLVSSVRSRASCTRRSARIRPTRSCSVSPRSSTSARAREPQVDGRPRDRQPCSSSSILRSPRSCWRSSNRSAPPTSSSSSPRKCRPISSIASRRWAPVTESALTELDDLLSRPSTGQSTGSTTRRGGAERSREDRQFLAQGRRTADHQGVAEARQVGGPQHRGRDVHLRQPDGARRQGSRHAAPRGRQRHPRRLAEGCRREAAPEDLWLHVQPRRAVDPGRDRLDRGPMRLADVQEAQKAMLAIARASWQRKARSASAERATTLSELWTTETGRCRPPASTPGPAPRRPAISRRGGNDDHPRRRASDFAPSAPRAQADRSSHRHRDAAWRGLRRGFRAGSPDRADGIRPRARGRWPSCCGPPRRSSPSPPAPLAAVACRKPPSASSARSSARSRSTRVMLKGPRRSDRRDGNRRIRPPPGLRNEPRRYRDCWKASTSACRCRPIIISVRGTITPGNRRRLDRGTAPMSALRSCARSSTRW